MQFLTATFLSKIILQLGQKAGQENMIIPIKFPIKLRINYKVLLLTYKALNG